MDQIPLEGSQGNTSIEPQGLLLFSQNLYTSCHISPVHDLPSYFLAIHFNIILPSTRRSL